jgi:predicted nucleic acid-binding Zn ribbon protein
MSILPEHSHCLNCDEPVDEGQEYCSDQCRQKFEDDAKRDRNKNMIFLGLAVVALIIITMVTLG